jgi:hypothetical protein
MREEAAMNPHFLKAHVFTADALIVRPARTAPTGPLLRFASSLAEVVSLAVFIAMIWVWAALASAPGV